MQRVLLLFLCLIFLGSITACNFSSSNSPKKIYTDGGLDLPIPPEGYRWAIFPKIKYAMLRPVEWHETHSPANGSFTGSVSKEDVRKEGKFRTGASVTLIDNIRKRSGATPTEFMLAWARAEREKEGVEVIRVDPVMDFGSFKKEIHRVKFTGSEGYPILVHKVFQSFDELDQVYIVYFECPAKEWDRNEKIWRTIFNGFFKYGK